MTLPSFQEIINKSPVPLKLSNYHPLHRGICPADIGLPVSINEKEYNYIYNYILDNGRMNIALDLATGIGISSLACSMAFKEIGFGLCVTVDSYEEENNQYQPIKSDIKEAFISEKNIGKNLHKLFDCDFHTIFYNYIIPQDLDKITIVDKFNLVILDCPKCDDDFEKIILGIKDRLSKNFSILIHDTHTFTEKSNDLCEKLFGTRYYNIIPEQTTFPFVLLKNY
jgi:hypothetical protein